jgi:hypothetical protein
MKTFEEKFTAWIDGLLTGSELSEFEAELESMNGSEAEREDARKLGGLLRAEYAAPELKNADFFNHQLMQVIEAEALVAEHKSRRQSIFEWLSVARMAWAGALSLLIAAGLYFAVVRPSIEQQRHREQEFARVIDAHTDDPSVTASSFQSPQNKAAVLWLDGLEPLPDDYLTK